MKRRKFSTMSLIAMTLMVMISCQQGTTSTDTPILKISAKDLGGLDQNQWSDVKEVDGKEARIIQQDEVVFTVPSWWGKNARPSEGEIFVLEIDYQDVGSNPLIVSSFGNCARSIKYPDGSANNAGKANGLSELHRIAGGNSGEWKTAMVPVSWDYLYAGAGNPRGVGNQEFSITLEGDDKNLPIAEVRIRKATKEDEVQYNADTRAWIKKRQEKYYVNTSNASVAPLPGEWKSKDCVPYVRSYLTPVLPFDFPEAAEMGATLKVRMALNEIECKQLAVYANARDLEGVSIRVSELKNDKGELLKPKTNLYTVEYAFIKGGKDSHKLDAQRIWPLFETTVKAGNSQAFWLTFETREETALPGVYKGEISVLVKGDEAAVIPLEIEVLPIKLLTMDEAGLSMGGCVTGFIPFHNISYAMDHNVNATNLWVASIGPGMTRVDGKLVLDFTLIDEWMKEARRLGLKNIVYFLGGNPYGFPRTMSLETELFVLRQKQGTRQERFNKFLRLAADESNRGRVLEEIRGDYSQWVKEVSEHALENGWPELILTPFDEPAKHRQKPYRKEGHQDDDLVIGTGPWIKGHFEDACKLIRDAAPTVRIYSSIHHSSGIEFLPVTNVFCTNAIDMDPALGDKVRAGGDDKYFWQYTGVGAGSDPARMRYSYGFYFGAFDSRGSLLWAYNWGSRFDTTEGDNWMICWDTPFSTIPTLSYEGLREAWDDRRYIETLKQAAIAKGMEKEVHAFMGNIFTEAVQSKAEGGEDTVNDFWNETTELKKLDKWRYSIADKIIEISK